MKQGIVIVISAPSGAGKTTITNRLLNIFPSLYHSVSFTTRCMRSNESSEKDYFFVSVEGFKQKVKNNEFAEWAEVHGNLYGSPKKTLEEKLKEGRDVLLDIDIQGAEKIRKLYPNGLFIFIMPPSLSVLKERLLSRKTETPASIEKRLKKAEEEMAFSNRYNYVIVNKDIEETVEQLKKIIEREKNVCQCCTAGSSR